MSTPVTTESTKPTLSERRRQASRELMRAEILDAAQHIIRTQGLEALSLRALAKSVGVTAPALYEYFPNKDAMLKALFVQGSNVMLARMAQVIGETAPGIQRVLAILTGYRAFARDEPDYFRLLFATVDPGLSISGHEYAGMQEIYERFIGVIIESIEIGHLRSLPPMTMSGSLWALIHGAALLETQSFLSRKQPEGGGGDPYFDAAVRLTLLGFATDAGAALIGPVDDIC